MRLINVPIHFSHLMIAYMSLYELKCPRCHCVFKSKIAVGLNRPDQVITCKYCQYENDWYKWYCKFGMLN